VRVLFLCSGNACRSQMAEGWARALPGGRIRAFSAGIEARGLDPRAVLVMREEGLDISGQRSKRIDELEFSEFDLAVTVCARAAESCPAFSRATRVLHVPFDDPPSLAGEARTEAQALEPYRRVRDEIGRWVGTLPEILGLR